MKEITGLDSAYREALERKEHGLNMQISAALVCEMIERIEYLTKQGTDFQNKKTTVDSAGQAERCVICRCTYCAKRADCMPGYDDETLEYGANEGHAPTIYDECRHYIAGDSQTRERALKEREEFNVYAENLIRQFSAYNK